MRKNLYFPVIVLLVAVITLTVGRSSVNVPSYDPAMIRNWDAQTIVKTEGGLYAASGTTTSGQIVFNMPLSPDGTSVFKNKITSIQPIVNSANASYAYSWVVSADRKTVTLTVNSITLNILGAVLLFNPAANGTPVNVLILGY